jgi:hypothetical protein
MLIRALSSRLNGVTPRNIPTPESSPLGKVLLTTLPTFPTGQTIVRRGGRCHDFSPLEPTFTGDFYKKGVCQEEEKAGIFNLFLDENRPENGIEYEKIKIA